MLALAGTVTMVAMVVSGARPRVIKKKRTVGLAPARVGGGHDAPLARKKTALKRGALARVSMLRARGRAMERGIRPPRVRDFPPPPI